MVLDYREISKAWDEQKPIGGRSGGKSFWLAIKIAIEKQIPQKPRIETTKEVPKTNNLGRLLYFYCPRCGKFIVGSYETDKKRGGGISQKLNGCSNCLQSIDFSEWQKKESDDLVLED
jgi:transcription elongation factor Elf1|nr:MAG: hypothetical protein [Bacteriophage sp.]DAV58974.1 MAG TPA: Transcription factor S-II (TFIIS) [Bacteriophage sp.]